MTPTDPLVDEALVELVTKAIVDDLERQGVAYGRTNPEALARAAITAMRAVSQEGLGASPLATGLAGAEAPEPPSRLGPSDGIPSATTFIQCGEKPDCDHDFQGWREFDDGLGGESVCGKCGIGAMEWSMGFLP
jgi:hypothetical protein